MRITRALKFFGVVMLCFFICANCFSQEIKKKRGKVTLYYDNNKTVKAKGKVKNHKKEGEWNFYDKDGKLESTKTFRSGVENGMCTEYYQDQNIFSAGRYVDGKLEGLWTTYYESGKIKANNIYQDNQLDGAQIYYYENGKIFMRSFYFSGKPSYVWTWNNDGRPNHFEYYANGQRDGTWRIYPQQPAAGDTCASEIDEYANGMLSELTKYSNCVKREQAHYHNGNPEGEAISWNSEGQLISVEEYSNGLLNGKCVYYDDGKILREMHWKNGKRFGADDQFDIYGTLLTHEYFGAYGPDTIIYYQKNGKISNERVYRYYPGFVREEQFSQYSEYDENGILMLTGEYHFEAKNSKWQTFYPNGKVKSETTYNGGKMDGIYTKWYMNGKVMLVLELDGGSVVAQPKAFDYKGRPLKEGSKAYNEIVDGNKPGEVYDNPAYYHPDRTKVSGNIVFITPEITNQDEPPPPIEVDSVNTDLMNRDGENNNVIVEQRNDTEEAFTFAEQMPEFAGGTGEFYKFMNNNLKYPKGYEEKQGTVWVQFIVEKDGTVSNIKIAKPIPNAPDFDKEAMRLIALTSGKWSPAKMNGRAVRLQMTMPVKFRNESAGN
ncbi:MAG: TonB family protein [Bacteroidetes bacterium]|nr:TonB family protein [Bacteroidota bacterium]